MSESAWLAKRFEENRAHLRAVAYRMLGSWSEADDAVQEVWLRLSRSDAGEVDNLGGWLTTVVARLCLDMLRSRRSRREELLQGQAPEPIGNGKAEGDPEDELTVASSIGPALLVVLETLAPAERVAFVLHDMFDVPFEEIAPIVGRSPAAARQLASRARRRVRGAPVPGSDVARQREVVDAFLAASRDGDFDALVAVLAPDVVLRADEVAVRTAAARRWGGAPGLSSEIRGARAVAETFKGRARGASPALIDGDAGAVWAVGGRPRTAFVFRVELGRITEIELVMDPARLSALDIEIEGS
jgi:RNA polymerase sigma factor (sigma-70 family)